MLFDAYTIALGGICDENIIPWTIIDRALLGAVVDAPIGGPILRIGYVLPL